jgi:hypothetical protein
MSDVAKPLRDDEVEFKDEDDCSAAEVKKAVSGFTPTQKVSWPLDASPPREPEAAPEEADQRTRSEHKKANRVLDSRKEAEKARQDDHRHDSVVGASHRGAFEARWGSGGFTRESGKHTAHTGPLTRGSGRLKILPDASGHEIECDLDTLQEIAKRVLRGRNATIFEKLALKPLEDGNRKPPVREVAAQFNIKESRVYKILEKCWAKVSEARASYVAELIENIKKLPPCQHRPIGFDPSLHYAHREHDKWPWPPHPEEKSQEALEREYKDQIEKWENTYGVNRPYGPKHKESK